MSASTSPRVVERSRKVAERLSNGVAYLMRKNKIEVIKAGTARLTGQGRIAVTGEDGEALPDIEAKHIIVATGARARTLPGLEPDGRLIWTYKEAMVPPSFPKSLLIVGSGAIGIEFASFYRSLGAEVDRGRGCSTASSRPRTPRSPSLRARPSRGKASSSTPARRSSSSPRAATASPRTLRKHDGAIAEIAADRVILAIGITGNVEGLGLEEQGVGIDKGHIVVDEWCRTGAAGLYAIGDVVGPPWLAHKASHEGIICVEKIAGVEGVHPLDKTNIPGCTYSSPQIASVGLTEEAAREGGHALKIGHFPYSANGKAIALGETEGLVKTDFRCRERRSARRASDRGRGDRADPGLRYRQDARDHRGRADGDHLPPPDIVGDDGRIGARRLWPRASHLIALPRALGEQTGLATHAIGSPSPCMVQPSVGRARALI